MCKFQKQQSILIFWYPLSHFGFALIEAMACWIFLSLPQNQNPLFKCFERYVWHERTGKRTEHMQIMFSGLVWSRRPRSDGRSYSIPADRCWPPGDSVALLRWPSWPWSHESKGILGFSLMLSIWRRETSELQDLAVFFHLAVGVWNPAPCRM